MIFKFLCVLLKLGRLFGLNLNKSTKNSNSLCKSGFLWFCYIILAAIVVASAEKKYRLFRVSSNVSYVVVSMTDITAFGIMIFSFDSFQKRRLWKYLIQMLKKCAKNTVIKENLIIIFLVILSYLFSTVAAINFGLLHMNGFDYCTSAGIVQIENFVKLYSTLLMLILLKLILHHYKCLKTNIELLKFDRNYLKILKKSQIMAYTFKTFVDVYNEIFGFILLCQIGNLVVKLLQYVTGFLVFKMSNNTFGWFAIAMLGDYVSYKKCY